MARKKKSTLDKKVIDKEDENLVRELTPHFKEIYGKSAVITGVKLEEGSMEWMDYKISVEYKHKGKLKKKEHDVSTTFGSYKPFSIDGECTEYGQRLVDSLAEFGEFLFEGW